MGKKVEYRDTFHFHLFPKYTYTRAQERRFLLFQGRIEHWRAAINYADSFDAPNKINLLYMIGYNDKIKAYVEKTKSNLVVLCAEVPKEFLSAYDNYWKLVEIYHNVGLADENGNFCPLYFEERRKEELHRGDGILPDSLYQRNDLERATMDAYARITEEADTYFSRWRVIGKSIPERSISHENLDWIIKRIFPFGREQSGMGDRGCSSFKRTGEALQRGFSRSDCADIMGLPKGTVCLDVCKDGIYRCKAFLNTSLRKDGAVDLVQVMERMKQPPYGWACDTYSAFSFGYAVSSHLDDTWIWDEVYCFPTKEIVGSVLRNILRGNLGRRKSFVLLEEPGYSISDRLAYLFDIGAGEYTPRDDTDAEILSLFRAGLSERKIALKIGTMSNVAVHKRLLRMQKSKAQKLPVCNMAQLVCKKIESVTRWPVSLVDEHLTAVICGEFDNQNRCNVPVFGRQKVRDLKSYFTWDKCKEIKKKLNHINEYVPDLIRQRYGVDVDIDSIHAHCTTQSSGWLWTPDIFWDCIDRQMK